LGYAWLYVRAAVLIVMMLANLFDAITAGWSSSVEAKKKRRNSI
jgi:hypothetical protein